MIPHGDGVSHFPLFGLLAIMIVHAIDPVQLVALTNPTVARYRLERCGR